MCLFQPIVDIPIELNYTGLRGHLSKQKKAAKIYLSIMNEHQAAFSHIRLF
jgi:hypothetical protein